MSYFNNFNPVLYKFGDETTYALAVNLTQYADVIDQVKTRDLFVDDYTIPFNERPDQTAYRLYGNADYYWALYLVNDHIRERGWPLTSNEVNEAAKKRYPHRMVTMKLLQPDVIDFYDEDNKPIYRSKIIGTAPDNFPVGSVVTGSETGTKGIIIKRDLALGTFVIDTENVVTESIIENQVITPNANGIVELERTDVTEAETFTKPLLWTLYVNDEPVSGHSITIDPFGRKATIRDISYDSNAVYKLTYHINTKNLTDGTFKAGEEISYPNPAGGATSGIIHGEMPQYLGTHHYEDADGNWIDINPIDQSKPIDAIEVTMLDYLNQKNEELRQIKVIKPSAIKGIANEFAELMSK
jgi:hypothetical protein